MTRVEWRGLSDSQRDELFARLNDARKVGQDGKPYYEGDPFFEDVVGVLQAALKFPEELPEAEARRVVGEALFAPEPRDLSAEGLSREIDEHVAEFLDAEPRAYMLVGSLSAKHFGGLGETEISGCRISFHARVPEPYREGHRQKSPARVSRAAATVSTSRGSCATTSSPWTAGTRRRPSCGFGACWSA